MSILQTERSRRKEERMRKARLYGDKLREALFILRYFDEKNVDDIATAREIAEADGQECILMTTKEGYQCLIDEDGSLIASHIIDPNKAEESI